jgi:adenylyltransferase/sulfurtransferase
VNDACVLLGKPNVYGSIFRFEGQASVFALEGGPCYRCLFPEPPPPGLVPSCAEGGVLGVLPGLVGTIQATEAIKLILDVGESLAGRLLLVDTLAMQFRTVTVQKDPVCPVCGTREIRELIDYEQFCGVRAAAAEPRAVAGFVEITPRELTARLSRGEELQLLDVREQFEWDIARIPGARLVPLATLPEVAETLDKDREIVVYCKGGARSRAAAAHLTDAGFRRVANLAGGILRWRDDVDPALPRY